MVTKVKGYGQNMKVVLWGHVPISALEERLSFIVVERKIGLQCIGEDEMIPSKLGVSATNGSSPSLVNRQLRKVLKH
jgi:hypothetical protein